MSKTIKLKDNTYLDSSGIMHNKKTLDAILDNDLNKNTGLNIFSIATIYETTETVYQILDYTIPSDGTYLIIGYLHPNYRGESGRELAINLECNDSLFYQSVGVCNSYTWTLTTQIGTIKNFKKNDKFKMYFSNSDETKTWSNAGGQVALLKLNNDT